MSVSVFAVTVSAFGPVTVPVFGFVSACEVTVFASVCAVSVCAFTVCASRFSLFSMFLRLILVRMFVSELLAIG